MSLSVTVSGANKSALVAALLAFAGELGDGEVTIQAGAAEKKGPGRPPKAGKSAAEMAEELGLDAPTPAPAAKPKPVAVTEEQVRAALNELMAHRTGDADETSGMTRVKDCLKLMGVVRIKDLKPEQYAETVERAQKA